MGERGWRNAPSCARAAWLREAFILERPATFAGERTSAKAFAYRDEGGTLQVGDCDPKAANLECKFETSIPGTNMIMTYSFATTLLPQRGAIENGLRALVSGWRAEAR